MFVPKTSKIRSIQAAFPNRISELETFFDKKTAIYVDYANIFRWSDRLGWKFDTRRMKQFFDSFDTVAKTYLYQGTLVGNPLSEQFINDVQRMGYFVRTKPVKTIRKSIDTTSISENSPDLVEQFVSRSLMRELSIADIRYLNRRFEDLNKTGKIFLEDRKCNFDVEMGLDILLDVRNDPSISTYVLWTGDSDFHDIVEKLLSYGKSVYVFGTSRKISSELANSGATIYEIQKIRNFLCRNDDIESVVKVWLQPAKETP